MVSNQEQINLFFYETEIEKIGIAEKNNAITNLFFQTDIIPITVRIHESEILVEAARQLKLYFQGKLHSFTLPLSPYGTDFMVKVWNALQTIPYGTTSTYKEIAFSIGNQKSIRAVGMANNRNPIPLFIPCHRVIGSNGDLTGYRGGLEIKRKLLDLEKRFR